jgi:hypothetical protein
MKTNRGDARLVITYPVCNLLGPFCFANNNEDRLPTVEHQEHSLLQQLQPISPGSLDQNSSWSLTVQRFEQWFCPG